MIHVGAMFGTTMAFNVWFRIWPAQQKIITAIKNGQAPDAALVGLAGLRSRHNTYMSAALIWTMISLHTSGFLTAFRCSARTPSSAAADDPRGLARRLPALQARRKGEGLLMQPSGVLRRIEKGPPSRKAALSFRAPRRHARRRQADADGRAFILSCQAARFFSDGS